MKDYRADIDGLRAVAILLVVVFHFDILSIGKAGFIGVDVFFVISGFLITGIVARQLGDGTFRLTDFFYRRVRRLYPAMLATLLLYGIFAWFFFLPDLFQEFAREALLSLLYVVNVYFWRSVNYFGLQTGDVPLLHMWLLAVEEQFYLLFPLFCLAVHRWAPRHLPGWFALLPTLGAAALIIGGFNREAPVTRALSTAPAVWMGRISYPLYLVHWPVLIGMQSMIETYAWAWRLAGLGLSILLAWGIYRWVETPLREGKILAGRSGYLLASGATSFAMIVVAGVIVRSDGAPHRFPASVLAALEAKEDADPRFRACQSAATNPDTMCRLGADDTRITILVIGDSHAEALAPAIDLWLTESGRAAAFVFGSGCLPVQDAGDQNCVEIFDPALEVAKRDPDISDILFVSIWRQPYENGMYFGGRWYDSEAAPAAFPPALMATVTALIEAGKQVTLIEPLYALEHSVPDALAGNLAFGRTWSLEIPLSDHEHTFSRLYAAFDQAETAGARRLSLISGLCSSGSCPGVVQGQPAFRDNNHLANSMTSYMAEELQRGWAEAEAQEQRAQANRVHAPSSD